jgi:hypothetical protein
MKVTEMTIEDGHEKITITQHNSNGHRTLNLFRELYCPFGPQKTKTSCFTLDEFEINRLIRPLFIVFEQTIEELDQ